MTDEQVAYSIGKLKEYGIVDSREAEQLGSGAMIDERRPTSSGSQPTQGSTRRISTCSGPTPRSSSTRKSAWS
jgi:hypothetical protein